jgi:plastocyanin
MGSADGMRLRALLAPALVAFALVFSACGSSDDETSTVSGDTTAAESTTTEEAGGSAPAPSGEAQRSEKVEIVEFTYQPDPVVVQTGGKVIWQSEDMAPHTATADDGSFDTGTLEKGKLKSETFKQAGNYPYFCEIHPDMRGTVEVVDAS